MMQIRPLLATTLLATSLLLAAPAWAQQAVESRLSLSPGAMGPDGLQMQGFSGDVTPGRPALPYRDLRLALHPAADLTTLQVRVADGPVDTLPGRHDLAPNLPFSVGIGRHVIQHWGDAGAVTNGRDRAAYGGELYPAAAVSRRGHITNRRGLLVLRLRHTPLRYRHETGALLLHRNVEVTVRYRLRPGVAPFAPDHQLTPHLRRVANPGQAADWYGQANTKDDLKKVGLAIVIRDSLAKGSQVLKSYVTFKEALGFKVTIVGDKELLAMPIGPKAGDAERIRMWLQKNYKSLDLKFVLLVGNPDPKRAGVPMKSTYAMAKHYRWPTLTPTDYYYADLTGNWDLDGDGQVAEYSDDVGTGGIDWTPEVYVGRIPIYDGNVEALDRILRKTISYQSPGGDRTWRKRVLQPAAMLFYEKQYGKNNIRLDGADMANTIYKQSIKPFGLSRTTMFEEAGVDPSKHKCDVALTKENLVKVWNSGFGLVTWFGHGSSTGVYRTIWKTDNGNNIPDYKEVSSPSFMTYSDILKLDDSKPSIVYHGSCSNGYPERPDNIGYGLLLHGAVGTCSSTRVAIVVFGGSIGTSDANIFGIERDFTKFMAQGKSQGQALLEGKQKISDQLGMLTWFTRLQINLYGDPTVTLTSCNAAADCDDGDACNGKEVCHAGQCHAGKAVSCTAVDPCVEAACDKKTGKCAQFDRKDGMACDDGKFCTANDVCMNGRCSGTQRCALGDNPCVTAVCSETGRTCQLQQLVAEGRVCRAGTSRQGVCAAGLCRPDETGQGGCGVGHSGAGRSAPLLPAAVMLAAALLALLRRRHGGNR